MLTETHDDLNPGGNHHPVHSAQRPRTRVAERWVSIWSTLPLLETVAVHDTEGHDWMPAAEIVVRRSYSFNESEVLAREAQEAKLLKEMQTDAVQQIVRRLQAAKKPE